MASLRFLSGSRTGGQQDFDSTIVVGRTDADVELDDAEVSRRHVQLTPTPAGVIVEDLGSSNGTFVAGRKITEPTTYTGTVTLRVGQTEIELVGPPPPADATRLSAPSPDATRVSTPGTKVSNPGTKVSRRAPVTRETPTAQPDPAPVARAQPAPARRAAAPAPAPPGPAGAPYGGAAVLTPDQLPAYAPATRGRPLRGPATRLIAPAVVTALVIIATAIALVIYFAAR